MAGDWTWERIGVMAGAILGVAGVITLGGFTIDPPWALADDLKTARTELQAQIDEIKTGFSKLEARQEEQNSTQLRIQRVQMAAQLREALADLRENPNSISAARAVEDAREALAAIDKALSEKKP
jgi:hypothetical protein